MNEKLSKRRIQIIDLQKKEIEEKQEIRLLIRLHIFYLILLINLWTVSQQTDLNRKSDSRKEQANKKNEF